MVPYLGHPVHIWLFVSMLRQKACFVSKNTGHGLSFSLVADIPQFTWYCNFIYTVCSPADSIL